ncbi:MAG TPA: tetratricopeptide repeat protein [Gaiellaceae bacterium]|nr:tetratricopeptide repeat protein [Gaiellaceae bacterium]
MGFTELGGSQEPAAAGTSVGAAALGERVRALRVAAGLSQSQLAAGRCSKEYVSQIERGKTRPTAETLAWLAERLGADPSFLASGVPAAARSRLEAVVARAEALGEQHRHEQARDEFSRAAAEADALGTPELRLRSLAGEAWARMELGEIKAAIDLLLEARTIAEGPRFTDLERADVLFRLGVCRYKLSSISTATALFDEALALAERSGLPCDRLRADILGWRSRCYRRQRDYLAAREDVERALELAEALGNPRTAANVYFQASLVAERQGHLGLARSYAERARACYEELADRGNVGRLLNNLGGLTFQLGKPEEAVEHLKSALRTLLEEGSDVEAAHVVCSLAEVHLHTGRVEEAEAEARKALELLGDRVDYVYEIGTAQLALGRSLLEQDRLDEAQEILRAADRSFEQFASVSHRAAAWVAMGDLAARRGDDRSAARLYRRAAEALQDVHF